MLSITRPTIQHSCSVVAFLENFQAIALGSRTSVYVRRYVTQVDHLCSLSAGKSLAFRAPGKVNGCGVIVAELTSLWKGLPRSDMAKLGLQYLLCLVFTTSALAANGIPNETDEPLLMEAGQFQGARRATHRPTEKELVALQDRLGYKFKNINLLIDALTHSSFSEANNDLLHVLGSKTVQQAIALHMIMESPYATKSELDAYIAKLSNIKDCAKDAVELGLDSLIMIGKAVQTTNKILSAAFNAVFGAITIDDGPTTANFAYWTLKKWKDNNVDII